ncbi:tRNA (adenosine(37)-N6)-dimethylallyltransferase MiaA, partial [candidate division KSB1 bacterium]|nr:tRNA (adenosine(37)-N6)-dimethylallyltransferase MiaA [candidate division KSB1 bacterium]NIT70957.1 tRNA (adenosine(37)-N6)-dimethylallyltransferase MiaA [candidate division KSB1 bacterium]NIU24688.1 tRNA (adenosine(37)-N6)-dimethylallyltransferase MiaA [candidate division KSB1 bacterium]NIU89873.1 tRNA (adenosine(37)-N6)-dimethylallyltransferase MiaA [candidate division KSB1 bacterium]NIW18542.1 tRNA (adenosine(37)-N6)-dimethylallyltransferase MiaA [candidate division KSB1 bacterium]
MKQEVLFIVGPTGVGKTEVSLEVARHLDAEIVSADSRQIYRYMDIGTAKPSREQLAQVPHHFIDIRSPDEPYSAGQYGQEAR